MSWTYNSALLASSPLYQVRLLVGDTDTLDQLVSDEEINWYLTQNNSTRVAAAEVCEAISAKFARWTDASVGGTSESASQKSARYAAMAKDLKRDAYSLALPVFGGVDVSQHQRADQDTGAIQPSFRIGDHDNPESASERTSRGDDWTRWP